MPLAFRLQTFVGPLYSLLRVRREREMPTIKISVRQPGGIARWPFRLGLT